MPAVTRLVSSLATSVLTRGHICVFANLTLTDLQFCCITADENIISSTAGKKVLFSVSDTNKPKSGYQILTRFSVSAAVQSVEIITEIGSYRQANQYSSRRCTRQVVEELDERIVMDVDLTCDTLMTGRKVSMTFRGINQWLGKRMQVQICEIWVV